MNTSTYTELFKHPIVLSSIGAVVVIAIGSAFYYASATRIPETSGVRMAASSTAALTATGVTEPAENPDLAFESGGRVSSVRVRVGQSVGEGQLLASLDVSSLYAQRAEAMANVSAAQARLAQMQTGARAEDVAAKQTAVDQANTALQNLYTTAATQALQSYDKAFSGFSQNTDSAFNQPNSSNPSLLFSTSNTQAGAAAVSGRILGQSELAAWQEETNALSATTPTKEAVTAALNSSLSHLGKLRAYGDQLFAALSSAIATNGFSQASISAGQVSVASYRDSVNTLTTNLQSIQQQITLAGLAVQSAQNALNQTTASSTPQQIAEQQASVAAAQARVQSIDAQIQNETIVAPFAGTVASVHIKVGDVVSANSPALSLNPESALQIAAYFSAIDITKIQVGMHAQVTLDAYGSGRVFDAQVVSVDSAPSQTGTGQGGPLGYKATLQFLKSDPAVSASMTANITIPLTLTQ